MNDYQTALICYYPTLRVAGFSEKLTFPMMKYYVKLQAAKHEKETIERRPYGDSNSVGIVSLIVCVPHFSEKFPRHQHSTVMLI